MGQNVAQCRALALHVWGPGFITGNREKIRGCYLAQIQVLNCSKANFIKIDTEKKRYIGCQRASTVCRVFAVDLGLISSILYEPLWLSGVITEYRSQE